jgi:hypothetical protein
MKIQPCPDCGKQPISIYAAGIQLTTCLGHSIKAGPGANKRECDQRWNEAVERYLAEGGASVDPVVVEKDERPKKRAPDTPATALSVNMSSFNAELKRMAEMRSEIEQEARRRLVGLPVRYLDRDCFVTGVTAVSGRIHVLLWGARKNDPKREYCGDEIARNFVDFDKVEVRWEELR